MHTDCEAIVEVVGEKGRDRMENWSEAIEKFWSLVFVCDVLRTLKPKNYGVKIVALKKCSNKEDVIHLCVCMCCEYAVCCARLMPCRFSFMSSFASRMSTYSLFFRCWAHGQALNRIFQKPTDINRLKRLNTLHSTSNQIRVKKKWSII